MTTLATFLTRAYCAQNKLRPPSSDTVEALADVTAAFRESAGNDDGLLTEARAESARLAKIPAQRCLISKTHGAFLTMALEGL